MSKDINLKQLNLNLGTMEELLAYAEEVGIEPEEGVDGVELAQTVIDEVDALGDDEWEELSEELKNWANKINAAKKAFKQKQAKDKGKGKAKEPEAKQEPEPKAEAKTNSSAYTAEELEEMTVSDLQDEAKSRDISGFSKMKKPELINSLLVRQEMLSIGKDPNDYDINDLRKLGKHFDLKANTSKAKLQEGIGDVNELARKLGIDVRLAKEPALEPEEEPEAGAELEAEPGEEPEAGAEPIQEGASKGLTKKQLEAKKEAARKKAEEGGKKSKQTIGDKPYKPGTSAWHVTQVVKEAGKDGITLEEAIEKFTERVKEYKLQTVSPSGRVRTIIPQAIRAKGLITKDGDVYKPTKKLLESE